MNKITLFNPDIDKSDIDAVTEAMQQNRLTRGMQTRRFEEELALFLGAKHVISCSSGTTALYLVYKALKKNDTPATLSTSPVTFASTATNGILAGYDLKLIDINSDNALIEKIPEQQSDDVTCLVHYAGVPCPMEKTNSSKDHVIEDGCHALGSSYPDGSMVGSNQNSKACVFSFHDAKNITTGEGGAICTEDDELAQRIKRLRHNGIQRTEGSPYWIYEIVESSINGHMSDIEASLGISQLKKLPTQKQRRLEIMQRYHENFKNIEGITLPLPQEHVMYNMAVSLIDFDFFKTDRSHIMPAMNNMGIECNLHYLPLYEMPFYKKLPGSQSSDQFPSSQEFVKRALTLPLHIKLTDNDVDRVSSTLINLLNQ